MKRKKARPKPLAVILVVVIALFSARIFILDFAVIRGRSMLPTLGPGEIVAVFKAAYGLQSPSGGYLVRWGKPAAGDIVAGINPVNGASVVKRVAPWSGSGGDSSGRVFLVGDNRTESSDSREYGAVPVESLRGRVLLLPSWPER